MRGVGGLIGLAGLAWLFVLAGSLPDGIQDAVEEGFFLVFALIAVASAVQMISQRRPVYAALFFVLVVLSVCGVLVMLEAFFMAFRFGHCLRRSDPDYLYVCVDARAAGDRHRAYRRDSSVRP